jgi:hypothetical protein
MGNITQKESKKLGLPPSDVGKQLVAIRETVRVTRLGERNNLQATNLIGEFQAMRMLGDLS